MADRIQQGKELAQKVKLSTLSNKPFNENSKIEQTELKENTVEQLQKA
jgi:hypothetical protein